MMACIFSGHITIQAVREMPWAVGATMGIGHYARDVSARTPRTVCQLRPRFLTHRYPSGGIAS